MIISGAVALYLFSYALLNGLIVATLEKSLGLTIPHIEISPGENESYIPNTSRLYSFLEKVEDVEGYSPRIISYAIISKGNRISSVHLIGVDPLLEEKTSGINKYLANGTFRFKGKEIVLGKSLADKLKITLNETVRIIFPNGVIEEFRVVGVYNTGIKQLDESVVYCSIYTIEGYLGLKEKVNYVAVKLRDPSIAEKIAEELCSEGFNAKDWGKIAENIMKLINTEQFFIAVLMDTIVAVTGLGIMNVMILLTESKKRDIGILKAIGATSIEILLIFLFIAVVYGVLGFILGTVIAYGFAKAIGAISVEFVAESIRINFVFTAKTIFESFLFSLVVSGISCSYSAYKSSVLKPVEVIRFG